MAPYHEVALFSAAIDRMPQYGGDPFRIACEVRLPGCTEFEQITEFEAWGHELLHVDGRAEGWSELPPSLRPEFLTMARTLGAVLRLTPLAGTTEERYPGEPLTSRDYLCFGSADDLKPLDLRHEEP